MKQNYTYKWNDADWLLEPQGSNKVKEKLDDLKKYLTFERKQLMSRYEIRLYEWILKKQYKADPIELYDWVEETDSQGWTHRYITNERYYLGYYHPTRKHPIHQEDKYEKEQQKHRARYHTRIR
jgi:hypothetical protein